MINKTMTILKKLIIPLLLLSIFFSSLSLTGCVDKTQIEDIAMVVAIGFDLNYNNQVIISLQIIDHCSSAQNSEGVNELKTSIYKSAGATIYDALFNLSKSLNKSIGLSNEKCIIIGKNFASSGISEILDFSIRFSQMRPTTPILVTTGNAFDILSEPTPGNSISAFSIDTLIKRQRFLCLASTTTNLDFINNLKSDVPINTCGLITLNKDGSGIALSGSGVFKKDKLIGYLNSSETRGMYWIKGRVALGNILITSPNQKKMSLHIKNSKSKISSHVENNKISFNVNIKADSSIAENSDITLDFSKPQTIDLLSNSQDKSIYREASLAVNAAQTKLSTDIFNFGNLIYRQSPSKWNKIKNNWNVLFPKVHIEIIVSSEIKQTGATSKSILSN